MRALSRLPRNLGFEEEAAKVESHYETCRTDASTKRRKLRQKNRLPKNFWPPKIPAYFHGAYTPPKPTPNQKKSVVGIEVGSADRSQRYLPPNLTLTTERAFCRFLAFPTRKYFPISSALRARCCSEDLPP